MNSNRAFHMPKKTALALANHISCNRAHFNKEQIQIIADAIHDRCHQIEVFQLVKIITRPDLTDVSFYGKTSAD